MNESVVRALSGIVYISVLVSATLYSPVSFLVLFGLFLFLATLEFCRLVNLDKTTAIILATIGFVVFAIFVNLDFLQNILLTAGALFVSVILLLNLFGKTKPARKDTMAKIVLLIGYIIIPFILIIKLPAIKGDYNPHLIIGMFVIIWANDTFAYIVGKLFGKHKLLEHVSPKKPLKAL